MQYVKTNAPITGIATGAVSRGGGNGSEILANTSFKVVEGKLFKGQDPVSSFTTDDKGNFYLQLPVGIYSIVEQERPEVFTLRKSTANRKWDNRCLKKQWQTPLLLLSITTAESKKIELHRPLPADDHCLKK